MSLLSCWDSSFIDDGKLKLELLFSYKPKFGYKESGNIKYYDKLAPSFGVFFAKNVASGLVNIDIIAFRGCSGYGVKDDSVIELVLESPELYVAFGEDLKSHMERLNAERLNAERLNTERLNKKRSGGVCGNIMRLGKQKNRFPVSSIDRDLENRGKHKKRVCSMMVQENESIKRLYGYAGCENHLKELEEKKVVEVKDLAKQKFKNIGLHESGSDDIYFSRMSGDCDFSINSISASSGLIALGGLIGLMSSGHILAGLVFCVGALGVGLVANKKPSFGNSFREFLNNNNVDYLDNVDNVDDLDNIV